MHNSDLSYMSKFSRCTIFENRLFAVGGIVMSVVRSLLPFGHVGEPQCPSVGSWMMKSSKKVFLQGYLSSLQDAEGKKWYLEKLSVIRGLDP